MLLYNTVHQPNPTVWTATGGRLLGESPSASFPFDGPESMRASSALSPSVRPRNSQSRVTPGNSADDPQRHFLAERSTALDIAPSIALDTEKLGKLLLVPAPIEAHCLSQAARTF